MPFVVSRVHVDAAFYYSVQHILTQKEKKAFVHLFTSAFFAFAPIILHNKRKFKGVGKMVAMVFTNYPVKDVQASTEFYEKLGFKKNEEFSNEQTSSMVWDDTFWIMLLEYDFYNLFLKNKKIADTQRESGTLTAFSVESPDVVKKIAEAAKTNGGDYFSVDMNVPEDQMFSLEVTDIDGNQFEPVWMDMP